MYLDLIDKVSGEQRELFVERMRDKGLHRFSRSGLYPFCTEDIACYLGALPADGGRCLTVSASGDQAINLLMAGADEVVAFDVVPETEYLLDLKLAALAASGDDPHEFRGRFLDWTKPRGLSALSRAIGPATRDFFEDVCLLGSDHGPVAFRPHLINGRNAYIVDRESFARAKAAVVRAREGKRVGFIQSDLRTLPFVPGIGTFDAIVLSNVIQDVLRVAGGGVSEPGSYRPGRAPPTQEEVRGLVGSMVWPLARLLRPGGAMMAAYVFSVEFDDEGDCDTGEAEARPPAPSIKDPATRSAAFAPPPGFSVEEIRTEGRNSDFDGRDDVAVIVRRLP